MGKKVYRLRFKIKSPLHISFGNNQDSVMKTARFGRKPFLPASTVKGKIRSNFKSLLADKCCDDQQSAVKRCKCPACSIFGKSGYQPSKIYIQNLEYSSDKQLELFGIRSTVAIDRYRKVAQDGALAFTEVIDNGLFEGNMEVYFTDESIIYEKYLMTAVNMIESIGKGKSRGWGFVDVEVTPIE